MSSKSDTVEAVVTFVVFRKEVMAFFRAYRNPDTGNWDNVSTRMRGTGVRACLVHEGYVHYGQHGEFDATILRDCRRARPYEYATLLRELEELIGYKVTPHQKGRLTLKGRQ